MTARAATSAARAYCEAVRAAAERAVAPSGRPDPALLTREQHRIHGLAWIAATIAALEATLDWAMRAERAGRLGATEELAVRIGFGEYLAQIAYGVPMSAQEVVRPAALGTAAEARDLVANPAVARLLAEGSTPETRVAFAALLAEGARPD